MSNQELSRLSLLPRLPTADGGVFFLLPLFPGQGRRFYATLFQTGSCWQTLKTLNSVNSVSKLHVVITVAKTMKQPAVMLSAPGKYSRN